MNQFLFWDIPGATGRPTAIRIDDTFLPGCTSAENRVFGVRLRSSPLNEETVRTELATMLANLKLTLQLATESSPGASKEAVFEPFVDIAKIVEMLKSKGVIEAADRI